jgi:hypothetical protein
MPPVILIPRLFIGTSESIFLSLGTVERRNWKKLVYTVFQALNEDDQTRQTLQGPSGSCSTKKPADEHLGTLSIYCHLWALTYPCLMSSLMQLLWSRVVYSHWWIYLYWHCGEKKLKILINWRRHQEANITRAKSKLLDEKTSWRTSWDTFYLLPPLSFDLSMFNVASFVLYSDPALSSHRWIYFYGPLALWREETENTRKNFKR